ncbi:hypothetical protein KY342_03190 [Candidatus Woesearchaeota archaeon]|nr:hypothetical protein [Candidatus Woesearchaeota archaeon]
MPPIKLRERITLALNELDKEFEQREKPFLETTNLKERIKQEEEQIDKSLDEAVPTFDELLNLLDKEHVIIPSGKNLNLEKSDKIINSARIIYVRIMIALHLTRDHDLIQNPKLRALKDNPELNKYIPIQSLKKKVKAHFICAELYAALGVRIDPTIEDRSERVEYEKVIEEGKLLFKRLKTDDYFSKIRLAHDIGASYKRLFDLFVEEEKKSEERYGKIAKGESFALHDYIRYSKKWYNEMFDIQNINPDIFFDSKKIFHTEYEFNRYLHDIEDLNGVGCGFQNYTIKEISEEEPQKFFTCSKGGKNCKYNKKDSCTYSQENTTYYEGLIARVELMREL